MEWVVIGLLGFVVWCVVRLARRPQRHWKYDRRGLFVRRGTLVVGGLRAFTTTNDTNLTNQ